MRAKDVHTPHRHHDIDSPPPTNAVERGDAQSEDPSNLTNLLSVDVDRLAIFYVTNVDLVSYPISDTITAFYILKTILGWRPLLASLAGMGLILLINIFNIRRYSRAESDVMKARDDKLAVVSEALTGIRQIKFSAMEKYWEEKFNLVRRSELHHLWRSLVADVLSVVTFSAAPTALTVIAFAAYSYFEGSLKPSIAFCESPPLQPFVADLTGG